MKDLARLRRTLLGHFLAEFLFGTHIPNIFNVNPKAEGGMASQVLAKIVFFLLPTRNFHEAPGSSPHAYHQCVNEEYFLIGSQESLSSDGTFPRV